MQSLLPQKNFKENFRQISEVGSGTYGKVYKVASVHDDQKFWAFKKITYSKDNEGFPQTTLREIKILKSLDHQNVIKLHDIITSKPSENNKYKGTTFLIFDYMDHDLWGLMKVNAQFNTSQVKCIMKQLLEGMLYIHSQNIIHRDIKSANILLNNKGEVKIADFGLARNLNSLSGNYTSCVVTLWYRSPELLLGSKKYTAQVDMWSIGCIMAELILGNPLFTGDKEARQCELIFDICGVPDEANWPACKNLPFYSTYVPMNNNKSRSLKQYFLDRRPGLDSVTLDFLDKLLLLNPDKRLSAKEALQHEYFHTNPLPCSPAGLELSKFQECHITLMNMDKKKRDARKNEEDSLLRKRRYSEFEKKGKSGNYNSFAAEKDFSFKSPEVQPPVNIARSQSYAHYSETRVDSQMHTSYTHMEIETQKPYEALPGLQSLFSTSYQTAEKKSTKDEGNYLSNLLQQSSYKKKSHSSHQSETKHDPYRSESYKKVHL